MTAGSDRILRQLEVLRQLILDEAEEPDPQVEQLRDALAAQAQAYDRPRALTSVSVGEVAGVPWVLVMWASGPPTQMSAGEADRFAVSLTSAAAAAVAWADAGTDPVDEPDVAHGRHAVPF